MVCLKTVLKNLLLKKFSRVVVVYCSVIKVLCLCRSFQATAFIFYQKLLSLSRTFLFFFVALFELSFAVSATAYLGYHFQNSLSTTFLIYFSIISLIFKSSSFLPIKKSRLRVFFHLPFLCCFLCCSSATNVILSQLFLIVNVFYIFHAIQTILTIYVNREITPPFPQPMAGISGTPCEIYYFSV